MKNSVIEEALKFLDTNTLQIDSTPFSDNYVEQNTPIVDKVQIDYSSILTDKDADVSDSALTKRIYDSLEDKSKFDQTVESVKTAINQKLQSFLAYGRLREKHGKAEIFLETDNDQFDVVELELGANVEMEHTNDPTIAIRIAMDHLTEAKDLKCPKYYTWLKFMEDCMKKGICPEDLQVVKKSEDAK